MNTDRIYLDNAATSFPKPPEVYEAMARYARDLGASPGRGAYRESREAGALLDECRSRINTLINGAASDHVVFTLNCSDALNIAIKGIVHPKASSRHIVTTVMAHNSVLRPFNALVAGGVAEQTLVRCDPETGLVDPGEIERAIRVDTGLVAVEHASNVTGTLQPVGDIGRICRARGVPLLVDAAQSVGHLPVDVVGMYIDLLAMPGHKGLLGPLGTGALYIRPELAHSMRTIREGGTGSVSEHDTQPEFMPDKFEPGSHNAIGLIGLSAALQWILDRGVDRLWDHELRLINRALAGLSDLAATRRVKLFGPQTAENRCGVFSIRVDGLSPDKLARELESRGVLSRAGLHCAPRAHALLGTAKDGGTTRLSLGPFCTLEHVDHAIQAVEAIAVETAPGLSV
ncbi:MAG: aminotransferase class V-fold PLP-dependent enzyme [Phycisphaerales bacterium]